MRARAWVLARIDSLSWDGVRRLRKIGLFSAVVMVYTSREIAARTVLTPTVDESALAWLIPLLLACMGTCLSIGFAVGRWSTNQQRDLLEIERRETERDAREKRLERDLAELRARLERLPHDDAPSETRAG